MFKWPRPIKALDSLYLSQTHTQYNYRVCVCIFKIDQLQICKLLLYNNKLISNKYFNSKTLLFILKKNYILPVF